MQITLPEAFGWRRGPHGLERSYAGELEFEVRDRHSRILSVIRDHNIVKVFAKEILAHRLVPARLWDPNAGTGTGAWVDSGLNLDDFSPKYIVFGASFDEHTHLPLDTTDTRFYNYDQTSGMYAPIGLGVGADYGGGLINAVPISEPLRPLKRVERIYFEPSYQPSGTPLLAPDVRAMNNTVVFETTLRKEEYNGFGLTASDYFTLTEVALVAGREQGDVGACECDPHDLFLDGLVATGGTGGKAPLPARLSGTATVTLEGTGVELIREGDQVMLVSPAKTGTGGTGGASYDDLGQVSPYYLVISKVVGGSDLVLDRTPVDTKNVPLAGTVGVFRDGFRIFSHRVLKSPIKKSEDFEIVVRWKIHLA